MNIRPIIFGLALLLLLAIPVSPASAIRPIDCGAEGQDPCDLWEVWWLYGGVEAGSGCDRGLDRRSECPVDLYLFEVNTCKRCREKGASRRNDSAVVGVRKGRDYWVLAEQRKLAANEPISWVMQIAGHNAYNNIADSYVLKPNQTYSITDQLRMGARTIMLDVYDSNAPACGIKLSHATVVCTDRHFDYAIKEIKAWLDENPREIVIIDLEDSTTGDGVHIATETEKDTDHMTWALERYLGSRLLKRSDPVGTKDSGDHFTRWPTANEMLSIGRQVIVFSDGESDQLKDDEGESVFKWQGYYRESNTSVNGFVEDGLNGPERCFEDGSWVRRSPGKFLVVFEDRAFGSAGLIADRTGVYRAPRYVGAETQHVDARDLADCNVSIAALDFIADDDVFDRGVDKVRRRRRLDWSWQGERGENNNAALYWGYPNRIQRKYGSWDSRSPREKHHFACKKPRPALDEDWSQETIASEWLVTGSTGLWYEGPEVCTQEFENEGYVFGMPVNAMQQQSLERARRDAMGEDDWDNASRHVWIAYADGDRGARNDWKNFEGLALQNLDADVAPSLEGETVQFTAFYSWEELKPTSVGTAFSCARALRQGNAGTWTFGDGTGMREEALTPEGKCNASFDFGPIFGDADVKLPCGIIAQTEHRYVDDGDYFVDHELAATCRVPERFRLQVVENVAPIVRGDCTDYATCPDEPVGVSPFLEVGDVFDLEASFRDPGSLDTIAAASIDWGDGSALENASLSVSTPTSEGIFGTLEGSHIFDDCGLFDVDLAVSDDDGGVGHYTVRIDVADPTAVLTCPSNVYAETSDPDGALVELGSASYEAETCGVLSFRNYAEGVFDLAEPAVTSHDFPVGASAVVWEAEKKAGRCDQWVWVAEAPSCERFCSATDGHAELRVADAGKTRIPDYMMNLELGHTDSTWRGFDSSGDYFTGTYTRKKKGKGKWSYKLKFDEESRELMNKAVEAAVLEHYDNAASVVITGKPSIVLTDNRGKISAAGKVEYKMVKANGKKKPGTYTFKVSGTKLDTMVTLQP